VHVNRSVSRGNHLEREEKRATSWGKRRERDCISKTKIRAHTSAAEIKIYIYIYKEKQTNKTHRRQTAPLSPRFQTFSPAFLYQSPVTFPRIFPPHFAVESNASRSRLLCAQFARGDCFECPRAFARRRVVKTRRGSRQRRRMDRPRRSFRIRKRLFGN
jgi:hypothetical protein